MDMSILQASRLSWDRTKCRNTVHNLAAGARGQRNRRQGHKSSVHRRQAVQLL